MDTPEFKEKSRKLIFNSELRNFPIILEMYVRAFNVQVDLDVAMADIVRIIRTSESSEIAHALVCHYLDDVEGSL